MGYTPQNLCFKKEGGKLTLTDNENCRAAKYFEKLLNCDESQTRFPKKRTIKRNADEQPPTEDQIRKRVAKLKNGKTSGKDGVVAELLKSMGPKTMKELTEIIREYAKLNCFPSTENAH